MHDGLIIFVASHCVIAACCLAVNSGLAYVLYQKPKALCHKAVLGSVMVWIFAKMLVHMATAVETIADPAHVILVTLLAINAVASAIAACCILWLLLEMLRSPTLGEVSKANDALAVKLAETTEEKQRLEETVRAEEKPK